MKEINIGSQTPQRPFGLNFEERITAVNKIALKFEDSLDINTINIDGNNYVYVEWAWHNALATTTRNDDDDAPKPDLGTISETTRED